MRNEYAGALSPKHVTAIRCALARLKLRDEDRDDIEQEVYLTAPEKMRTPGGMATIAFRMGLLIIRHRKRCIPLGAIAEPTTEMKRERAPRPKATADEMTDLIAKLPENEKFVLLQRLAGSSQPQIAGMMGLSQPRVFAIEKRAIRRLRDLL